jgi:hypothetical protein
MKRTTLAIYAFLAGAAAGILISAAIFDVLRF